MPRPSDGFVARGVLITRIPHLLLRLKDAMVGLEGEQKDRCLEVHFYLFQRSTTNSPRKFTLVTSPSDSHLVSLMRVVVRARCGTECCHGGTHVIARCGRAGSPGLLSSMSVTLHSE